MKYISYWDNVLSKDVCDEIINRFENNVTQQKDTLIENHRHFTEININHFQKTWSDIQNILFDKVNEVLPKYTSMFNIDPIVWPEQFNFEQFRIKRYEPNDIDEFKFHSDIGNYESARRFLVFFWYLNNVEKGGETCFQSNPKSRIEFSCKPVTGRMIVFPASWTYPHSGMKPISGKKYIIGSYLHYV